jgi:hypothetical protein
MGGTCVSFKEMNFSIPFESYYYSKTISSQERKRFMTHRVKLSGSATSQMSLKERTGIGEITEKIILDQNLFIPIFHR